MSPPPDHPLRYALTNELHARPVTELIAPEQASHFAMIRQATATRLASAPTCRRSARATVSPRRSATRPISPPIFGQFRLKWERHTEFTTYTFFHRGMTREPFVETAAAQVPADWLAAMPGQRIVATNIALVPQGDPGTDEP